jgi:hypothetical protein
VTPNTKLTCTSKKRWVLVKKRHDRRHETWNVNHQSQLGKAKAKTNWYSAKNQGTHWQLMNCRVANAPSADYKKQQTGKPVSGLKASYTNTTITVY